MSVKKNAATRRERLKKSSEELGDTIPQETKKDLKPAQCRAHMRNTLAKEFDGIVKGFVKQAKSGSCPHVKLATELLEPRRRAAPARKTGRATLARWVEEVERGN